MNIKINYSVLFQHAINKSSAHFVSELNFKERLFPSLIYFHIYPVYTLQMCVLLINLTFAVAG